MSKKSGCPAGQRKVKGKCRPKYWSHRLSGNLSGMYAVMNYNMPVYTTETKKKADRVVQMFRKREKLRDEARKVDDKLMNLGMIDI